MLIVLNDFNYIAPIYDLLARLVFGSKLKEATNYFLQDVPRDKKVLVLGGGTGNILHHLTNTDIVFLDQSKKMLAAASEKRTNGVTFIEADFLSWDSETSYDVIICPFFLDVFSVQHLELVIAKISALLRPEGQLIVTDFQDTGKRKHKFLLVLMHRFFRVTARLESKQIQPLRSIIGNMDFFKKQEAIEWMDGLIFSERYRKGDESDDC